MKTTATLESLNLSFSEAYLAERLRESGWTEDEIFCTICEDRDHAEKIRVENAMSDWYDNRY